MPLPDKKKSSYQQELERRADDLLRVYNPTDKRYVVEYDKKNGTKMFPVEAKSEAVFVRYIAEKYIKEMYNKIIIEEADEAVRKENERRIKVGMAAMDKTLKTNEQNVFESKFYIGNDKRAKEIISLLYMGVESEFGVDRVPQQETVSDSVPTFEKALHSVQEEKDSGVVPQKSSKLKCNYPGCDFETDTNIALIGHNRSHRPKEIEKKKKEAVKKISKK